MHTCQQWNWLVQTSVSRRTVQEVSHFITVLWHGGARPCQVILWAVKAGVRGQWRVGGREVGGSAAGGSTLGEQLASSPAQYVQYKGILSYSIHLWVVNCTVNEFLYIYDILYICLCLCNTHKLPQEVPLSMRHLRDSNPGPSASEDFTAVNIKSKSYQPVRAETNGAATTDTRSVSTAAT